MSSNDDEEQLRGQVELSVAGMPGPDPARMASIRHGLRAQHRRRRPGLWLAVALAFGISVAASAAWLATRTSAPESTEDAAETESSTTAGDTESTSEDAAAEGERTGSEDGAAPSTDERPVIYRSGD